MDELAHLPPAVQSQFFRVLESSLRVQHRGEFFLWAQGQLQALVPHGLMIGMTFSSTGEQTYCECLQAVPLQKDLLEKIQHPEEGLLSSIGRLCHASGQSTGSLPLSEEARAQAGPEWLAINGQWQQLALGPLQFVATGDLDVGEWAFFAFMCQPEVADPTQQLIVRILMPQLLVLLWRSRQYGKQGNVVEPANALIKIGLTERQLEILHWVKMGKTNNEIAQIVTISELTVKNHLQKVFQRLNVHNRAQAVAKIMSMGNNEGHTL
jgi:transcriptional regulator EpsA